MPPDWSRTVPFRATSAQRMRPWKAPGGLPPSAEALPADPAVSALPALSAFAAESAAAARRANLLLVALRASLTRPSLASLISVPVRALRRTRSAGIERGRMLVPLMRLTAYADPPRATTSASTATVMAGDGQRKRRGRLGKGSWRAAGPVLPRRDRLTED